MKANIEWIRNNKTNKSTAFSSEEKKALNLEGLLPYKQTTQEIQEQRVLKILIENRMILNATYIYLPYKLEMNDFSTE